MGSGKAIENNVVQQLQNPFAQFLGTLDPIFDQAKAGTLTYQEASDALASFNQQWTALNTATDQYKAKGGAYATDIEKMLDPKGTFMKTVTSRQTGLQDLVNSLKPPDSSTSSSTSDATTPPGMPADATAQATMAAMLAKRRAMAGTGYSGTILGGAQGSTILGKRGSVLGY